MEDNILPSRKLVKPLQIWTQGDFTLVVATHKSECIKEDAFHHFLVQINSSMTWQRTGQAKQCIYTCSVKLV